jgi:hypothetical protein
MFFWVNNLKSFSYPQKWLKLPISPTFGFECEYQNTEAINTPAGTKFKQFTRGLEP